MVTHERTRQRVRDSGEEDVLRLEIETALARGVRVIPVLVDDADMPGSGDLPDSLAKLARRQARSLSTSRWEYDVQQIITRLAEIEREKKAAFGSALLGDEPPAAAAASAGRSSGSASRVLPARVSARRWSRHCGSARLTPPAIASAA
jgi:hypothetical protein